MWYITHQPGQRLVNCKRFAWVLLWFSGGYDKMDSAIDTLTKKLENGGYFRQQTFYLAESGCGSSKEMEQQAIQDHGMYIYAIGGLRPQGLNKGLGLEGYLGQSNYSVQDTIQPLFTVDRGAGVEKALGLTQRNVGINNRPSPTTSSRFDTNQDRTDGSISIFDSWCLNFQINTWRADFLSTGILMSYPSIQLEISTLEMRSG
ncbi:hypothetical protein B0O80DRAFT_486696 [Mortierella sp. GBAus27b]|nr:hypothetical protein B0O80DRAFT_486696 [Mortierella sp. GBAus27b]